MELNLFKILCKKIWKVLVHLNRLCGPHRLASLFIGMAMCSTTVYFVMFNGYEMKNGQRPIKGLNDTKTLVQNHLKEIILLEKGTGCEMPDLDPFSEEAKKFIEDRPKVKCEGSEWVNCIKSECFVVNNILETMKDISCTYREIIYVNDDLFLMDNPIKVLGNDKYYLNRSDHVKVSCSGMDKNGLSILSNRWYGYKAGFRPIPLKQSRQSGVDAYNVMILGFDSTSRNGFIRKMPNSYKYLAKKAVILERYNIVGDGTSAALFPILTGMAEEEHLVARKNPAKKIFVDDRLFIFHLLKEYGYRTAYFEDCPSIGSFQYKFNGFRKQPTDHYLRAFFTEAKKIAINSRWKTVDRDWGRFCVGATPQYKLMMDLSDEFLQLDGKKFCFTLIVDIAHNDFNWISTADEDLVAFLEKLDERKALEDTLVIIMGDHGFRFAGIRKTYQGKLEESLPLMAIILPERLKGLRPGVEEALAHNRDVLTTPFDLHATILDALGLKDKISKYRIPGSDLPRALSMLEPIPKSRSCAEAGVMPHWCACTRWNNVSQTDPIYNHVADVLAEYIDSLSNEQRYKCLRRKLEQIDWVMLKRPNNQLLKYSYDDEMDAFLGNPKNIAPRAEKEYYQAKIVMSPGRGEFEGTVTYLTRENSFIISEKDISRVNAYGDEPSCISETHPHLNKYCYCSEIFSSKEFPSQDANKY